MKGTPGEEAKALVQAANDDFSRGDIASTRRKLDEAFALREQAESYSGALWAANHHDFTEAMLDMAELRYMLGDIETGDQLASRSQAWADDPNCSSQRNFERSLNIRSQKDDFVRAGQDALQQNIAR